MEIEKRRYFTEKLTDFIRPFREDVTRDNTESNFCKKALKAYLRGLQFFTYRGIKHKTPEVWR